MQKGFNLVEMMIVIALIALLSSFAYGGWRQSLLKAQRIDAQQSLFDLAVALETCYQKTYDYSRCASELNLFETNEIPSLQGYFALSIAEISKEKYVIMARAINSQSNIHYQLNNEGQFQ